MSRRFVQLPFPPYDLVEVGADYVAPSRQSTDGVLWNDRSYHDLPPEAGKFDISSRTKHREYMAAHGLTTMDDFKDTWKRAEKERDEYRTTGKGGAVTKHDIGRAIAQLEANPRKES